MFNANYADLSIAHYKINDYRNQADRDRQARLAQTTHQSWFGRSNKATTISNRPVKEVKVS